MRKKEKSKETGESIPVPSGTGNFSRESDKGAIRERISSIVDASERDDRPSILEPAININPLSAFIRQGVFLNGMSYIDFLSYYYPQIRNIIEKHIDDVEWFANSSINNFIEWILLTLDNYIPATKWHFKNGYFNVVINVPFDGCGYGFDIGGWYFYKEIDLSLYRYICRVIKTFIDNFNYLEWEGDESEGALTMIAEQIAEEDDVTKEEYLTMIEGYKKGIPFIFKKDIYNAKELTSAESNKIVKKLKKGRTDYSGKFMDWLHEGIVLIEEFKQDGNVNITSGSGNLSHYIGAEDNDEPPLPAITLFPFIYNSCDNYFHYKQEMFSEAMGNYGCEDFKISVPYPMAYPKEKDFASIINKIKKWFHEGSKTYGYSPKDKPNETKASS